MTDLHLPPVSAALVANGVTEWATVAGRAERCPTCGVNEDDDTMADVARAALCSNSWHIDTPLPVPGERVAIWATREKVETRELIPDDLAVVAFRMGAAALFDTRRPRGEPWMWWLRPGETVAHATVAEVLPIVTRSDAQPKGDHVLNGTRYHADLPAILDRCFETRRHYTSKAVRQLVSRGMLERRSDDTFELTQRGLHRRAQLLLAQRAARSASQAIRHPARG